MHSVEDKVECICPKAFWGEVLKNCNLHLFFKNTGLLRVFDMAINNGHKNYVGSDVKVLILTVMIMMVLELILLILMILSSAPVS